MKLINITCLRMLTLGSATMLFATGCTTYKDQNKKSAGLWQQGQVKARSEETRLNSSHGMSSRMPSSA